MGGSWRIHVWIGNFTGTDEQWAAYFDVDAFGADCGFCRDTNVEWIDFDRFSAYNAGRPLPAEDVVVEVPFSEQFEAELLEKCRSLGIEEADHCFALINFGGHVTVGRTYLGLTAVGEFAFQA
jgi:hypothetical protein